MIHDFQFDVSLLNNTRNLNDKLLIFSVYNDLYSKVVRKVAISNQDVISCNDFLSVVFQMQLLDTSSCDKAMDGKGFVDNYIRLLAKFSNFNIGDLLNDYSVYLNRIVESMSYVSIIDSKKLDFESKTKWISMLNDHINNVLFSFSSFYGDEESVCLKNKILNNLLTSIPNILDKSNELSECRKLLKEETLTIIDNMFQDDEFVFYKFNGILGEKLNGRFDNDELFILMLGLKPTLAGYSRNDPDMKRLTGMQASKLLGMSYLKYIGKSSLVMIKSFKALNSSVELKEKENYKKLEKRMNKKK